MASGMNIMTEPIRTIDEFAAEYHKTIGQELAFKPAKEANLDNIRRYGDGAGDYNPLYRNPGYAANSRFGMVTAAPTFIYAVSLGVVAGETGNIDRARVSIRYLPVNYAGADIEFVRPIWLGDTVTATETVGDTMRKESKRIGSIQFNTGLVTYTLLTDLKAVFRALKSELGLRPIHHRTPAPRRGASVHHGDRLLTRPGDPPALGRARRRSNPECELDDPQADTRRAPTRDRDLQARRRAQRARAQGDAGGTEATGDPRCLGNQFVGRGSNGSSRCRATGWSY